MYQEITFTPVEQLLNLHDRQIRRYKKALLHAPPPGGDIKAIFERIVAISEQCREELGAKEPAGEMQLAVDVLADKKTILEDCLRGEIEILNSYCDLLSSSGPEDGRRRILMEQKERIRGLYDHIQQLHDAQ